MIQTNCYTLEIGGKRALLYTAAGTDEALPLSWPKFEIDGTPTGAPASFAHVSTNTLTESLREEVFEGFLAPDIRLCMEVRVAENSPIVRFRYILSSTSHHTLTKRGGEALTYFSFPTLTAEYTEVRFSGYDDLIHGYTLSEIPAFRYEDTLMGPILTETRAASAFLTAYEHGSQYPDKFIAYRRTGSETALCAEKGNYWDGEPIDVRPYETVWLEIGGVAGDADALAKAYRAFQLLHCTLNTESRKPYIFYNTWAYQERNRFWNSKTYLESMRWERIEAEIEIAHKMGIEVFVIDTGWYEKTGDWKVDTSRFPRGLLEVKEKLDGYGMKLGLWFNPTAAAVTSQILAEHSDDLSRRSGREPVPYEVWETEASYSMCLVSDYWEAFADKLIELSDRLGVTYFKWDAVSLYGCEEAGHFHGGPDTSAEESRDCCAFRIGPYMSKIVDKVCASRPNVIVDVDVTEGTRYFGLGFLASGKFFSMNNGPYYPNYDIQVPEDVWINIFVQPGPARTWVIRQNLCYDKWIPSVLMMSHYLPDDPESSQMLNLASLILGQNGIWGDLLAVSPEGVERIHEVLKAYKSVRDDITAAYPATLGRPGETFEVHEKIHETNGRGAAVLFSNVPGTYHYRMQSVPSEDTLVYGSVSVRREEDGTWLEADFDAPGAAIVFFR